MDFDPDFEFDAPRWFDFTKDEGENRSSFNDSWFENVHPRHEPKAPQQENTSGKPCLSKQKTNPGPIKKVQSKAGQINRGKGKKSLGIKTIRTKRGQHEARTSREHADKCCGVRETLNIRSDSGGQSSDGKVPAEDRHATGDEFRCDPNFTFNPSWSISPSIRGNNSKSVCQTSRDDKQKVIGQVEQNNSVEHVQLKSPFIRPALSPSLVGSIRNQADVSSPVCHSPGGSLLAKAVIGAAKRRPPGGTKKRLLPTIPPQKKTPEVNASPGRAELHKGQKIKPACNVKNYSDPSSTPCDSDRVMHPCLSETLAAPNEDGADAYISVASEARGLGQSTDPEPQQSESMCNHETFTFEHGRGRIVESTSLRDISPGANMQPSPSAEQEEMSVEELLKLHNQRILATKCRYDENGRRIRSATPTFCPASDKVTKTAMKAKRKSTTVQAHPPRSSVNSVSAATNKKLTPGSKENINLLSTSKQEVGADTTAIPSQYLLTQSNGNACPVTKDKRARYSRGEAVAKDNITGYSRGELQAVTKDKGTGYRGELQAVTKDKRARYSRGEAVTKDNITGYSSGELQAVTKDNITGYSRGELQAVTKDKRARYSRGEAVTKDNITGYSSGELQAVTKDNITGYSRGELQAVTKDNITGYSRGELQAVTKDKRARYSRGEAVTKDNITGYSRGELQAVTKDKGTGYSVQTTKKQARRSCMAKLSCPDTSSKHAITGQKRTGSSTERTGASSKQKRCSCVPSIGVNANAQVSQPSGDIHQNQTGVGKGPSKQKRRSCMADTKKASISDTEKELEELIHRHNSQLVAKKS